MLVFFTHYFHCINLLVISQTLLVVIVFTDIVSVEPQSGSPAGGTLITITGKHFTDPQGDIKVDISGTYVIKSAQSEAHNIIHSL